jgi:Ca2+-binding RTX toxin-like protein
VSATVETNDLSYNRITIPAISLINNDDGQDAPLYLIGTQDPDVLRGRNGNDKIYGSSNQDEIYGGRGGDRLYGQEDDDRLFGEEGNDQLYGGYDDDTLDGGIGNDELYGEQGSDTLLGGDGNDVIDGGIQADSMVGGIGNDTYYVDNTGDMINDQGNVSDVDTVIVTQTISYKLAANIENAAINAAGDANLTGNALNNNLTGNDGANILDGATGNDVINGGSGNDVVYGGDGLDILFGGAGNDVVNAGSGDDIIGNGDGRGNDTFDGGQGVDSMRYGSAVNSITVVLADGQTAGTASGTDIGSDLFFNIENVSGGSGSDIISGNSAWNAIDGGAGNDVVCGTNRVINGGRGQVDTLTGGTGVDVFVIGGAAAGRFYDDGAAGAGRNDYALVTDFTVGQDRIQLKGAASQYFLGATGINGESGSGVYFDTNNNRSLDANDELLAILRSGNSTALTAANSINTANFV